MLTRRITIAGLIFFGVTIVLSSCKVFQPVQVGPFIGYENAKSSIEIEIMDPVCSRIIETPQEDLIWQAEGKNYYFSSKE